MQQSNIDNDSGITKLPPEVLLIICKKYFEDDELSMLRSYHPSQNGLVFEGISPLTIELVNHAFLTTSRAARAEIWGRKLLIDYKLRYTFSELGRNSRYQWLWKHLRSLHVRTKGAVDRLNVDDVFITGLPENFELLRSLHLDIDLTYDAAQGDIAHHYQFAVFMNISRQLSRQSEGKLPDVVASKYMFHRAARMLRAKFGHNYELSIAQTERFREVWGSKHNWFIVSVY